MHKSENTHIQIQTCLFDSVPADQGWTFFDIHWVSKLYFILKDGDKVRHNQTVLNLDIIIL
jgi:hypothetical protein